MKDILVIEDSPIEAAIYRKLLAKDFSLTFCENAEDALITVKQTDFDLVISDINLPVMNGPEMIAEIRKIDRLKTLSIVVVSSDQIGIKRALSAGANGWFLKPISPKTFSSSIHKAIKLIPLKYTKKLAQETNLASNR